MVLFRVVTGGNCLALNRYDCAQTSALCRGRCFLPELSSANGSAGIHAGPDELRSRAAVDDEGTIFIAVTTIVAVCFSLISIFELLNQSDKPDALRLVLSIGSAPLAWAVLHTIAAFHYGHRYYADLDPGPKVVDAKGLKFPDAEEPTLWDFLYYSFVIGMTAQVSDVQVTRLSMRKVTLVHSVVSFFLNTVLIALAVNVAVALAQASH